MRRNFLWHGNKEKKGFHLVKWKKLTISILEGGLGIRNLRRQNKCLLMKWLWRFTREEQTLWGRVIRAKYGKEGFWMTREVKNRYGTRNMWPSLSSKLNFNVRDLGIGCLKVLFPDIFTLNQQQRATMKDVWGFQVWNLTFRRLLQDWELPKIAEFYNTLDQGRGLQEGEDTLSWKKHISGSYTLSSAYKKLNQVSQNSLWPSKHIWKV